MGSSPIPLPRGRLIVLAGALFFGAPAFVSGGAAGAQQAPHAHGVARLGIAVEGDRAMIELSAPADGIYGFEHAPRSDAERARRAFGLALLANSISQLVRLDAALGCRFDTPRFSDGVHDSPGYGAEHDESHAEVRIQVEVACRRPLRGSEARFHISRIFPALRTVDIQLITDEGQRGRRIVNDQGTVTL